MTIAGQLFINVYPAFIGSLETAGRATPAQLGRMVTVEYLSMALAGILAGKILPFMRLRDLAVIVSFIQLLAVVATVYVSGNQLLPVRAIFAATCGIQICIQYEFVARSQKPGQLAGLCTATVTFVAILTAWLGSSYVVPKFGVDGLILLFGLPSVIAVLGALMLPARLGAIPEDPAQAHIQPEPRPSSGALFILVSAFTWSAGISILWIYAEPLAKSLGISEMVGRMSVTASLVGGLAGAGLGAVMAERLRSGWILTGGLILCLAQLFSHLLGGGSIGYVIWFTVFGFLGYFLVPFFVKAIVSTGGGRRAVVFFPAAQYAGGGLGPLIASFVVSSGQYRGGLLVDVGCTILAIACLWMGLFCIRRISRATFTSFASSELLADRRELP